MPLLAIFHVYNPTDTHTRTHVLKTYELDELLSIRWGLPHAMLWLCRTQTQTRMYISSGNPTQRLHSTAAPQCGSSYPVKA